MKAYSLDLRRLVLADSDAGQSTSRVAKKYRVSPAWVRRLKQRRRETGEITPRRSGGRRPRIIDRARLTALVKKQPDATLAELRERLGLKCSLSALWMALDKLRITFKKKRCGPPSRIDLTWPSVARSGGRDRSSSIPSGLSSSTKPGRPRT
jgi:transposase